MNKRELQEYVRLHARELAASGRYIDHGLIVDLLLQEGHLEARRWLNPLRDELDQTCAKSRAKKPPPG